MVFAIASGYTHPLVFFYPFIIITMMEKEIDLKDVIEYIINHCDDKEAMDKINKITFPFTTRYDEKFWWKKVHQYKDLYSLDCIEEEHPLVQF